MGTPNGFASDMNVFQDDDGKGYVIYCDHGGHGVEGQASTYAIRIDSLSDDYLTSNKDGVVVFEKGCEAPAMIKHKGKCIAVASGANAHITPEVLARVPSEFAIEQGILPVKEHGGKVIVAIDDQLKRIVADQLQFMLGLEVKCALATPSALKRAIKFRPT